MYYNSEMYLYNNFNTVNETEKRGVSDKETKLLADLNTIAGRILTDIE